MPVMMIASRHNNHTLSMAPPLPSIQLTAPHIVFATDTRLVEPGTSVAEADNYRRGECGEIRIILKQRPPTNRPVIRNKLSDAPKQRSWQSAETEEAAGLDGHARRAAANER